MLENAAREKNKYRSFTMHLNGWMSDDREKLLSAGCDIYIVKTIDPERIMSQIRYLTDETA